MCTGAAGTFYRSPRWQVYDQIMLSRGGADVFGDRTAYTHSPLQVMAGGSPVPVTSRAGRPISFDAARRRGASDHLLAALVDAGGT